MTLQNAIISDYTTVRGVEYPELCVSYQVFGEVIGTAPVVLVFHALTGNSDVCSSQYGWWKEVIGTDKVIDLNRYTVIALDIPGNGYNGHFIENYRDFIAKDIAIIARSLVAQLAISSLYAVIGGSLGGGIAWEYAFLFDDNIQYLISVAADWKSTDWVIGITGTQEQILLNSNSPIADARRMAMFFYRTPQSLTRKFNRAKQTDDLFQVNAWLNHHGVRLQRRFSTKAYLMMNHLLGTIDYEEVNGAKLTTLDCQVIQIGIGSDILFQVNEMKTTKQTLDNNNITNNYYEIKSDDGHDAFLIENEQISQFLTNHF